MGIRVELRRLTATEWVILDLSLSEHDAHRTVACICSADAVGYDVIWLRDLGLASRYPSPADVVDEVIRVTELQAREGVSA